MKAISLWQPWATAIALGLKTIETRDWSTRVRGRVAIHAAKTEVAYVPQPDGSRVRFDCAASFDFFVRDLGFGVKFAAAGYTDFEDLPFGAIVALCDLVDCQPVERIEAQGLTPAEKVWGDYSHGRYGWTLRNVAALPVPVACTGRQGFFDFTGGIVTSADHAAAAARLARAKQASLPLA